MQISLNIPIRDEACRSRGAQYYGFAYLNASNRGIERHQFYTPPMLTPNPKEALALADDYLSTVKGVWFETDDPRQRMVAAAATVLRLCMKHGGPQLEVVVNAAADTGEQPQLVLGEPVFRQESATGGFTRTTTTLVEKRPDQQSLDPRLLGITAPTIYLPQEDFSTMAAPHEVLPVYRGASTKPVRVALLHTVKRATIVTPPDNPPDHSS